MKTIIECPPSRSLRRMLVYRGSLLQLQALGVKRVYSHTLGTDSGVSAEKVRKDFSEFQIKGNYKGGYSVDELINEMESIFYNKGIQNVIVVGGGNIGSALANYKNFSQRYLSIVATFDVDPSKLNVRSVIPVLPLTELKEIINKFSVRTAIITVPDIAAQTVCDLLVDNGILGIINFTPVILKVPNGILVNNVNLSDEIESVVYCVSRAEPVES